MNRCGPSDYDSKTIIAFAPKVTAVAACADYAHEWCAGMGNGMLLQQYARRQLATLDDVKIYEVRLI